MTYEAQAIDNKAGAGDWASVRFGPGDCVRGQAWGSLRHLAAVVQQGSLFFNFRLHPVTFAVCCIPLHGLRPQISEFARRLQGGENMTNKAQPIDNKARRPSGSMLGGQAWGLLQPLDEGGGATRPNFFNFRLQFGAWTAPSNIR
jgi:hypothetical protein